MAEAKVDQDLPAGGYFDSLPQWTPPEAAVEASGLDPATQEKQEHMPEEPPENRPPSTDSQYLIIMRHGERIDEVDKDWSAGSDRPYDPYLSENGEKQARDVAEKLKDYNIKQIYVSPFLRCLQTAMHCAEGLGVPPENWTVTTSVAEFLNPWILVRKGGAVPEGHINDWFWQKGNMKDTLPLKLPQEIASKVKIGETTFGRYPENLINSRVRFGKAYQDIADHANGQNVLIVTHGDGVNSSITRLFPWMLVYPVLHTGFTVAFREKDADGKWTPWLLQGHSGDNGVWWTGKLKPVYQTVRVGQKLTKGAWSYINSWRGAGHSNGNGSNPSA